MKKSRSRGAFSLVETTFSVGLMSFGFLTLLPLLAGGLKTARTARNDRATAEIAQTLVEEAKQGTLAAGKAYFDIQGAPAPPGQAAFLAQANFLSLSGGGSLTRLTLVVTPIGAPTRARTYAVILPPSS